MSGAGWLPSSFILLGVFGRKEIEGFLKEFLRCLQGSFIC
jgi:hypothetical protein